MSQHEIEINPQKSNINWNSKGENRIIQNVVNILNTYLYEVAYDRVMGRNPDNIDKPLDQFIPSIISETYELIEEYEPRAKIKDVQVVIVDKEPITKVVIEVE